MTTLGGTVILLTGATDGMGRALAADLGREGATVLRLITAPPERTGTGRYFDGQQESRANDQAYDPEARRQLRILSDRLTAR
jgi:NAD(P)-dependent dehydrogenase (short-subunit alcohol dehydrogenase family)